MKVLFAVNNENISTQIVKKYQKEYKEIISYKNMYYFNAIIKELQRDKSYDRIVISEELEPFSNNNYEAIDKFLFEKLDNISDEATGINGEDIPIILLSSDRRSKSEPLLIKLFGIGIYNVLIGQDRSTTNVCSLLNKPRGKKEAKIYYKIESDEVNYKSESEGSVSEAEIQNIRNHYSKLGNNEDRYVESFNNIAAQYNDEQLRIITRFLPLNVKAVLEEKSPKYQSVMTFGDTSSAMNSNKRKKEEGLKIGFLSNSNSTRPSKPVIVPTAVKKTAMKKNLDVQENVKIQVQNNVVNKMPKETFKEYNSINNLNERSNLSDAEINSIIQESEIQTQINPIVKNEETMVKRGRGRPKKVVQNEPIFSQEIKETVKKGRGRPRKNIQNDPIVFENNEENDFLKPEQIQNTQSMQNTQNMQNTNVLPGFDDDFDDDDDTLIGNTYIEENDFMLPDFDSNEKNDMSQSVSKGTNNGDSILSESNNTKKNDPILPGFDNIEKNDATLPGFDEINENDSLLTGFEQWDDEPLPGFDNINEVVKQEPRGNNIPQYTPMGDFNSEENRKYVSEYNSKQSFNQNRSNIGLLSRDRKIVSFVGTTKNGTSFLVNNLAKCLSSMGIKTAILDLTSNRNSYYIYTKNEENLRNIAFESIKKLRSGITNGIQVDRCLDVYTALPGDTLPLNDVDGIIATLLQHYSVILMDCDFNTPAEYFGIAQEIYVVQTMDILTIQPMTAFLRDLKAKEVLNPEKIRIVINKEIRVRGLTAKVIVDGLSFYNDPAMSFMTELFNKDVVKYCTMPFDEDVYSKYLEGVMDCGITINGYSKNFNMKLKELANMVYPLVGNKNKSLGDYSEKFSSNMNNTLEQMRNKY